MAIVTKYHESPSGKHGRISATDYNGTRVYVDDRYALAEDDMHFIAVQKLCKKLGLHGTLYCGWLKGTTRVWVFADVDLKYTV